MVLRVSSPKGHLFIWCTRALAPEHELDRPLRYLKPFFTGDTVFFKTPGLRNPPLVFQSNITSCETSMALLNDSVKIIQHHRGLAIGIIGYSPNSPTTQLFGNNWIMDALKHDVFIDLKLKKKQLCERPEARALKFILYNTKLREIID